MKRRTWFGLVAGLSLAGLYPTAQAMPRLAVVGVSAGGSSLAGRLPIGAGASPDVLQIGRPKEDLGQAEKSIWLAAQSVVSASDVLLVACLGGRFAAPMAQCLNRHLSGRGPRVHLFATLPFRFEGRLRRDRAQQQLAALSRAVRTVHLLDLDSLLLEFDPDTPFCNLQDDVLHRLNVVRTMLSH